jgi:tRNA A-37 threonylcarbamoyl transferase component Bud32
VHAATATQLELEGHRCPVCGEQYPVRFRLCPQDGSPLAANEGSSDPLLGSVVAGTYRVKHRIGRGGMADLYAAEHLRLGRAVALKVLRRERELDPLVRARFEREAAALSRIRSAHVLQVVDILTLPDGRPCVVNELLEGETLEEHLLRRSPVAPLAAVRIAAQVTEALAEAHANDVIHRDVKPSNVFLLRSSGGDVRAKLIDFGVAQLGQSDTQLTRTRGLVGTPPYMAPEQARGLRADERTDVYGVGALLYRMVTGRVPHAGQTAEQVVLSVLEKEPARACSLQSGLPHCLSALIEKAMARDRVQRYANMLELQHALETLERALIEHNRQQSARLRRLERSERWARPAALAVGLYALLVALVSTAALSRRLRGAPDGIWMTAAAVAAIVLLGQAIHDAWRSTARVRSWTRRVLVDVTTAVCAWGAWSLSSDALGWTTHSLAPFGFSLLAMAAAEWRRRARLHRRRR